MYPEISRDISVANAIYLPVIASPRHRSIARRPPTPNRQVTLRALDLDNVPPARRVSHSEDDSLAWITAEQLARANVIPAAVVGECEICAADDHGVGNPSLGWVVVARCSSAQDNCLCEGCSLGEGKAVELEDEVAAFCERSADGLEALLGLGRHVVNDTVSRVRHRRLRVAILRLAVRRPIVVAAGIRMRRLRLRDERDGIVWVVKVKGIRQVRHVAAAPRHHLVGRDVAPLCGLPLLDKHDLRVVVAVRGEDAAVARPGRDDVKRQPEARADEGVADLAVGVLDPFPRCAVWRPVWVDVVEPAAGLVVGDNQGRLVVLGRVEHGLGHLVLQPGAVVGGIGRMLGELHGSHDIRHLGQGSVGSLRVERVERQTLHSAVVQAGPRRRVLELLEAGVGIVVKVVGVLEDLPACAGVLVEFTDGLPFQRVAVEAAGFAAGSDVVVNVGVAALAGGLRTAGGVDAAGEPGDSVGICCGDNTFL